MVQGFLPQNTQVSSFYVPFYCEKCDYEGGHLFTVGREVSMEGGNLVVNFDGKAAAECKESECGVEMDVTEAKYFQFLKRR
jgi:hypothetical protein